MEGQPRSVVSPTENGSFCGLTRTASPAVTSDSLQNDSYATSHTTFPEIELFEYTSTHLGDRHAIDTVPITVHHFLHQSLTYQYLLDVPDEIEHEDLPFVSPNPLFRPNVPNSLTHHQTIHQPVHISSSPRVTTSREEDVALPSRPITPPPALIPDVIVSSQFTVNPVLSDGPQQSIQLQNWLETRLTEEQMRIGQPRWENEENGRMELRKQILNRHLALAIEMNSVSHT